ncbi:MAG: TetR/AcrR family transcriptional regulator [Verrucomicrobiota bacterium]
MIAKRSPKRPQERPQPYHHGDLHDALVRTARKLLEKDGLEHVSLRRVARDAGVSPAAPYHHFADKHALLNAVAVEGYTALRLEMLARMAKETDPAARRDACGVGYVVFAVKNPALFRLMFGGNSELSPEDAILKQPRDLAYGVLEEAVRKSSPKGEASPLTCLRLWALVHGIAKLILEGGIKPADYGAATREALAVRLLDRRQQPWP